jgi:hypothetical protein
MASTGDQRAAHAYPLPDPAEHAAGVVVAQPAEMGTADDEEKGSSKERDPQGNVRLVVHETATLSPALG